MTHADDGIPIMHRGRVRGTVRRGVYETKRSWRTVFRRERAFGISDGILEQLDDLGVGKIVVLFKPARGPCRRMTITVAAARAGKPYPGPANAPDPQRLVPLAAFDDPKRPATERAGDPPAIGGPPAAASALALTPKPDPKPDPQGALF